MNPLTIQEHNTFMFIYIYIHEGIWLGGCSLPDSGVHFCALTGRLKKYLSLIIT
jgi:hypothetical protein